MLKGTVGRAPSFGKTLLKGLLWTAGWTILASMGTAWLLNRELLRMEQTGYMAMFILLVCGLLLARKGAAGSGKERISGAVIGAGVYFLGLLAINGLFFGGEFAGFGTALLVLLVGTAAGIIQPGKGRGAASRRRYKIPKG